MAGTLPKGTWSGTSSGTFKELTTAQTINLSGLNENTAYKITISYNDNSGFLTANKSYLVNIEPNKPVFAINKYGIGVGGVEAVNRADVNVKGNIFATAIGGHQLSNEVNVTTLEHVGGGVFGTKIGSHTGALKITLPQSWNNTMLKFDVEIYNYSVNNSCTYSIAGYNYATNNSWDNVSAYATGHKTNARANLPVRFGHDGTKCCIYIGEVKQVWNYPQVTIRNFMAGYGDGSAYLNWVDGWKIEFVPTLGTITQTVTNPHVSKVTPADIGAIASADAVETATAGKVVKRDGAGDINCRLLRPNYQNQNTISGALAYRVNNSSDNYVRFCSDTTAIRKWLEVSYNQKEVKFFGNVKSGTVIFDKTKLKNGVKVSFMTSNKMGTDKWYYAINGKYVSSWTISREAKYCFDFTKLKPDGSVWMYETIVANPYRDTINSRRYDGGAYLHIGELNTLMVYLDHATNVCDNLTALIEYY